MHYPSITILYNPNSTGAGEKNARRFARRLERAQCADRVEVKATERIGHALELAYAAAKKYPDGLIVASSGDGGYNEVVNGVMRANNEGSGAATGLLASGNANDHYKALHKPYVVRRIKKGDLRKIDVLKLTATVNGKPWEHYAHSYIGFGVTSEIGKALNEAELNRANEVVIFLKTLVKSKPFVIKISGKKHELNSIIVSNVGRMSKIFSLSKQAKVDDGLCEVVSVEQGMTKLVGTMVKSATVGLPHEKQVKSYTIRTTDPLPVQLDGEVFTLDADCTATVSVVPKALGCII